MPLIQHFSLQMIVDQPSYACLIFTHQMSTAPNTHSKNTTRRDRVLFISALAIALLTLLGKAGEDAGLERTLKANTVKTRSYSLWRQGCEYYSLIPNMKDHRLLPLLDKFHEYLDGFFAFKYVLSKLDK